MVSNKTKVCCFIQAIISLLMIVLSIIYMDKILINLIIALWSCLIIYCFADFKSRCQMFIFLIAFFVFLIGRQTLERYGWHSIDIPFSNSLNVFAETLVLLSLTGITCGVIIMEFFNVHFYLNPSIKRKEYNESYYESTYCLIVRKISLFLFLFSFIFEIYTVLDVVRFVISKGYVSFYSSYVSEIPTIIQKIGSLSVIMFWIYMSTMPSKRKVKLPIVLFILYSIMTLGTGQRFTLIANVLTLFLYLYKRNFVNNPLKRKWISKRMIVVFLLLIPLFLIAMTFYNSYRFGETYSFNSILDPLKDFFYRQGVTINVLKRLRLYYSEIPQEKLYMFSTIVNTFRNGPFGRFLGFVRYSGNSVEYALSGNSLAHSLSYVVLGSRYLSGEGLGSSFLAETFHDLSYFGVVFVSMIYSLIVSACGRIEKRGIWSCAISLCMFSSLLFAIRGETDGFIGTLFNLSMWLIIILIHISAYTFSKQIHFRNVRSVLYNKHY